MDKRKLKRQLSLGQVVMLGTAGAIGAQILVLTGHPPGNPDQSHIHKITGRR
jgi:hypothetical protein